MSVSRDVRQFLAACGPGGPRGQHRSVTATQRQREAIGARIRQLRLARGWKVWQLAHAYRSAQGRLGCSTQSIVCAEAGRCIRGYPVERLYPGIAAALGVSLTQLTGEAA